MAPIWPVDSSNSANVRFRSVPYQLMICRTLALTAALTSFTEADYRDLQVLFNLAWFDPDFLAQAPLKALVDKGRNFAEADKKVVFDKALEVLMWRDLLEQVEAAVDRCEDVANQIESVVAKFA